MAPSPPLQLFLQLPPFRICACMIYPRNCKPILLVLLLLRIFNTKAYLFNWFADDNCFCYLVVVVHNFVLIAATHLRRCRVYLNLNVTCLRLYERHLDAWLHALVTRNIHVSNQNLSFQRSSAEIISCTCCLWMYLLLVKLLHSICGRVTLPPKAAALILRQKDVPLALMTRQ